MMDELAGSQVPSLRPVPFCDLCERADFPAGRLGLTTLPAHGHLLVVCRLCWLCANVRELATSGDVSGETIANVEYVLTLSYQRLRAELEQVHSGSTHHS